MEISILKIRSKNETLIKTSYVTQIVELFY